MAKEHSELIVSQEEQGIKLLRFLALRLQDTTPAILHKWIRSGQVRVNGKRSKPFDLLDNSDLVRVPPFAMRKPLDITATDFVNICPDLGKDLPVIACTEQYMILNKPCGLAVQGGSKILDSITGRMQKQYAGRAFVPAPVHRLDRQSSGIVVVGRTQQALKKFSALFANPDGLEKTYLAVVSRPCGLASPVLLLDRVEAVRREKGEFMEALCPGLAIASLESPQVFLEERLSISDVLEHAGRQIANHEGQINNLKSLAIERLDKVTRLHGSEEHTPDACAFNAACVVMQLGNIEFSGYRGSLLAVRLLTGRKHQIRVQLSSRGFPIIGDNRYRGAVAKQLYLHAFGLGLPGGTRYECLPSW